jgi:hypothetical protein
MEKYYFIHLCINTLLKTFDMLEKNKVHALPTEKADKLFLYGNKEWYYSNQEGRSKHEAYIGHHLYFTSDEEIKEDDWCICIGVHERNSAPESCGIYVNPLRQRGANDNCTECRKIVATTNPELWSKTTFNMIGGGVRTQTESTDIHKIPTNFIKAFVREQGIWEVMLEKEVVKSKIWTERDGWKYKLNSQGAVVVHPIKEKVYTKAQVIYFANYIQANAYLKHNVAELLNVFTFPK